MDAGAMKKRVAFFDEAKGSDDMYEDGTNVLVRSSGTRSAQPQFALPDSN